MQRAALAALSAAALAATAIVGLAGASDFERFWPFCQGSTCTETILPRETVTGPTTTVRDVPPPTPTAGPALGVYERPGDAAGVEVFASWLGRRPSIVV